MSVIETAVTWAIEIANNDSHGYSMTNRDGPDYDCSSFVSWAYYHAGLNTRPGGITPATGTMYNVFVGAGFVDVTGQINFTSGAGLERGDVILRPGSPGHTVMYIGDGRIVHASSDRGHPATGDQTGTEILCTSYYNGSWNYVLRYPEIRAVSLVRWVSG